VTQYSMHQCKEEGCGFRFPAASCHPAARRCPVCGAATLVVRGPYGERHMKNCGPPQGGVEVLALLDNIRSIYNVGSMFRTADGAGVAHMYLCGITPNPRNPRLAKTALGAERTVQWSAHRNGLAVALTLKEQGFRLWALEGGSRSLSLFAPGLQVLAEPVVLVVGNEVCGVDPDIVEACERIVSVPMQGCKTSLNAAVAFAVAVYVLRHGLSPAGLRWQDGSAVKAVPVGGR